MNIPHEGPTGTRTTVKFSNTQPGLYISGSKLLTDAKNFRRIAKLLQGHGEEEAKLAGWLMVYADQCQNAAGGMEAAAPAVAYDRDVRSDYAHADDTNYGD